jgi:hypothetical protein
VRRILKTISAVNGSGMKSKVSGSLVFGPVFWNLPNVSGFILFDLLAEQLTDCVVCHSLEGCGAVDR